MTAKDFQAIAGAIKDARDALLPGLSPGDTSINRAFDSLSRDLARVLATTNPRFDRARFLAACGVK